MLSIIALVVRPANRANNSPRYEHRAAPRPLKRSFPLSLLVFNYLSRCAVTSRVDGKSVGQRNDRAPRYFSSIFGTLHELSCIGDARNAANYETVVVGISLNEYFGIIIKRRIQRVNKNISVILFLTDDIKQSIHRCVALSAKSLLPRFFEPIANCRVV